MNLRHHFRNTFIAGLLVTLPISVTVFILMFAFSKLDNLFGPYVTNLLVKLNVPISPDLRIYGLGVVFTILVIYFVGLLAKNFLGKKIVQLGETIVHKVPVMRSIYTGTKQVIHTFASANTMAFRQVVLLEFPRKGVYSMAFITSESVKPSDANGQNLAFVFIPTTPNPTNGYIVMAPMSELIPLKITVEEGLKAIISVGLVVPAVMETESGVKMAVFPNRNILE
jgi:uncharacterized membrane protein